MATFEPVKITTPYNKEDEVLKITMTSEPNSYRLSDLIDDVGSYVFSIWYRANTNCRIIFNMFGESEQIEASTTWKKYYKQINIKTLTNKSIDITPDINTTTYFYEAYLAKGTIDTSWSPAPEDYDDKLDNVKTEFIQTADKIEEKVTANDGRISSLSLTVNDLKTQVSNTEGDISILKQTASSLSTQVSNNKDDISKLSQKSDEILISVSKKVEDLQIGGRNYVLEKNSQADTSNGITVEYLGDTFHIYGTNTKTDYEYTFGNWIHRQDLNLQTEKSYTLSVSTPLPSDMYLSLNTWYRSNSGQFHCCSLLSDGTTSKTFTLDSNSNGGVIGVFGIKPSTRNIDVKIQIKLEKGDKPTDWSPAPEDVDNNIQNVQSSVDKAQNTADNAQNKAESNENRLAISESSIKMLSDKICSIVTDSSGSSVLTQTSSGFEFNLSAIEKNINKAANDLNNLSGTVNEVDNIVNNLNKVVDDLGKKTAYIVMTTDDEGNPCIELGKEDNPFKVRITNTSVDFLEGSSRIAYVNNKALYIEKAVIKNELQIGDTKGFIWATRSNGNMGLRKVGGR